jgi:hypothetical protein
MTVGIAAICDSGKRIVIAADRMYTNYGSGVEFETLESKLERLSSKCAVLQSSNDLSIASELVDSVRPQMAGPHDSSISGLADLIKSNYMNVRLRRLDERIVVPMLGPDYLRNRENGVSLPDYLKNQQPMFTTLALKMESYDLSVQLLVAGVDNSGAHLFQVSNPGLCQNMDKLGYATIGSGQIHALVWLQLARQTRQTDVLTTLLDVYSAKRVSEVAPGVGTETDIAIIDEKETWWKRARKRDPPLTHKWEPPRC